MGDASKARPTPRRLATLKQVCGRRRGVASVNAFFIPHPSMKPLDLIALATLAAFLLPAFEETKESKRYDRAHKYGYGTTDRGGTAHDTAPPPPSPSTRELAVSGPARPT